MKRLLSIFLTGLILFCMTSLSQAATEIKYKDRETGFQGFAGGSDGRLDTSSRTDSRAYYNSRDDGLTFSLVWNVDNATSEGVVVYWKNTSTTRDLVISSVGVNSDTAVNYELNFVTGTAVGTTATPTNLNKKSDNDAAATAVTGNNITGLTVDSEIDHVTVTANGHEELRLGDRVRLGQNDAIAIKIEESFGTIGVGVKSSGIIFGFYE